MGRTTLARQGILAELEGSQKGKKELKKAIKAKDPALKQHFKKALKKLVQTGKVEKDGKLYRIATSVANDETRGVEDSSDQQVLPIAVRLRKEQETSAKKSVKFSEENIDLDDEIKRLEMELNQGSSSGESSDEESASESDAEPAVLSLSAYADDRIEHLPQTCLPEPGKYNPHDSSGPVRKRKEPPTTNEEKTKKDGLKEAVLEVLNGYKARSSERLPFYCRFCSIQYSNETEFFEHKKTEFHKTAVEMERKATYCRLCLKQLTSPEQMKEHLSSRPHKERLQAVRTRQRQEAKGQKSRRGQSVRQWT